MGVRREAGCCLPSGWGIVYALVDPRVPGKFFYIGKTILQLPQRLRQHMSDRPKDWTKATPVIQSLKAEGVAPAIVPLEWVEERHLLDRESFLTHRARRDGHPIVNSGTTPEVRRRPDNWDAGDPPSFGPQGHLFGGIE